MCADFDRCATMQLVPSAVSDMLMRLSVSGEDEVPRELSWVLRAAKFDCTVARTLSQSTVADSQHNQVATFSD